MTLIFFHFSTQHEWTDGQSLFKSCVSATKKRGGRPFNGQSDQLIDRLTKRLFSFTRYSIVEEAYLPSNAVVKESSTGKFVCAETQNVVEWNEEQNYLFRLREFKEPLRKWLMEYEVIGS